MSALRRVATRPTWLLSRANARSQGLLAEAFNGEGVRGYHFRLLAALEQYGPARWISDGAPGSTESDVVATLNELVARGLAQREPDMADRRRNVITITKRGADTLERLDAVLDDVQKAVLAPLTSRQRETLVRLLAKLI